MSIVEEAINLALQEGYTPDFAYSLIVERTIRELRLDSRPIDKTRARPIASDFKTIKKGLVLEYDSTAVTTESRSHWQQEVYPLALPSVVNEGPINQKTVRKALKDHVQVSCNCPAFLYWGFRYILTKTEDVYGKEEKRPPKIRNPQEEGALCKHLVNVSSVLVANAPKIARELKERQDEFTSTITKIKRKVKKYYENLKKILKKIGLKVEKAGMDILKVFRGRKKLASLRVTPDGVEVDGKMYTLQGAIKWLKNLVR